MVRAILAGTKTQTRRLVNLDRLRVRLPYEVKSELPEVVTEGKPLAARAGTHPAALNALGAVSTRVGRELLGLRRHLGEEG